MPSLEHEMLVDLLREHPELVISLLRSACGIAIEGEVEVVASTENLTEIQPTERRADLVLVARAPGSAVATHAAVVEVQLRPDPRKRFSWPLYQAVLRARLRCPVELVVLTLDDATAQWCAEPIALDGLGSRVCPVVIGPSRVPIVVEIERARRHPEIALLGVLAHRDSRTAFIAARTLLLALDDVDGPRAGWYADIVLGFVDEAVRRALEAEMNPEKYEFRSEFMRRIVAEGEERGRLVALAEAVLKVLEARGLPIDDDHRAIVLACSDRTQLEDWLARAVHARDIAELLASA
ncbi:MAG TPA: hypothetical protein VG755_28085 [Nannocystaceae bacterium]|nr:hypothetical protein [Nannocystaceae bacterium]